MLEQCQSQSPSLDGEAYACLPPLSIGLPLPEHWVEPIFLSLREFI